jgi:DNA-binding MarR family transcriptional regulator
MAHPASNVDAPVPPLALFEAFMTLFGTAQQQLKTRMQEGALHEGLGPLHLRALCLCQRDPGCTQQQLVQSMGRDKGQVARLLRELEAQQWLERKPDASDGRVWRLHVTPRGDTQCAEFVRMETAVADTLFASMDTAQRADLAQLLESMQARLTPATEGR